MPAPASTIHSTTQAFIDIYDITNDLVIMKDGSTALVLTVDAMNFGLLAEEEQDAIMYAYAGLLNSLNYSIQIVIRSQTKDATNYLNLLRDQEQASTSDTKRAFIRDYREFVSNLIRERNVLDKKFYIAIPATSLEMGLMPPSTVIPGVKKTDINTLERSVILDKAKTILEPKRDHLISQFGRLGLYSRQLQTQEIIQLFYTSYNPEAAEGQQITDTRNYITPLVEASTTSNYAPTPVAAEVQSAGPIFTPPAQAYGGTDDLAPPLPNQGDLANSALLENNDIYEQPPAIVDIPIPADAAPAFVPGQMPVAEPTSIAFTPNRAPAAPTPTTPPQAAPNPGAPTQETPVYQAPSAPATPLPVASQITPPPAGSTTPAPAGTVPLPPTAINAPGVSMPAPMPMPPFAANQTPGAATPPPGFRPPQGAPPQTSSATGLPLPNMPPIPEIK